LSLFFSSSKHIVSGTGFEAHRVQPSICSCCILAFDTSSGYVRFDVDKMALRQVSFPSISASPTSSHCTKCSHIQQSLCYRRHIVTILMMTLSNQKNGKTKNEPDLFPSLGICGDYVHLAVPVENTDSRPLIQEMRADIWLETSTCETKTYSSDFWKIWTSEESRI
jgi:hypothetical protein